jgi:hypothetical protein
VGARRRFGNGRDVSGDHFGSPFYPRSICFAHTD